MNENCPKCGARAVECWSLCTQRYGPEGKYLAHVYCSADCDWWCWPDEWIGNLRRQLAAQARRIEQLTALLESVPRLVYTAYGEALHDGCDHNGARDCVIEAVREHVNGATEGAKEPPCPTS